MDYSEEELDYEYVVQNVLTNTDRFLEGDIFARNLKTWHVIFFVSAGTLVASNVTLILLHLMPYHLFPLVITLCCFIRLRLPRTKSEICANAQRKALLKNFRSKLTTLKSADLDDMDYRRGMYSLVSNSSAVSDKRDRCGI